MRIEISNSYDELSRKTADFIVNFINKKPDSILSFAAGNTPEKTFEYLVQYAREGKVDFSKCKFIGLDEWVGLGKEDEGSCKHFMHAKLFEPLSINPSNTIFFDACAKDLESECKRVDSFIEQNGPIDLMLVGLGMNGHIGFNEPGTPFDLYSHTVDLDDVTKEVGKKYFKKHMKLEKGITLGLRHLMNAKTAILIVSESKKAPVVKKVVEGDVTPEIPGSIIKIHSNGFLFLDRDAASMLSAPNK